MTNTFKFHSMMNKSVLIVLLLILSTNGYSQSPWVNKKGSIYAQISATYLGYSNVINEELNQLVQTDVPTHDITVNVFADYSLTDKLAVLASIPYKSVDHNNNSLSSLGDPSVKLKYRILENIPLAVNAGYTAPLSKRSGILRTGYNQHAVEGGLSIGMSKKRYFIYGGLGYRYRSTIPNQVLVEFEYGYQFQLTKKKKPFFLIFRIDGMLRTSSIADVEAGQANLYHNNGEFISPALKLSYNVVDNFWINAGVHSAVFVRNFGGSSTFNIGFAYKLEK